MRLGIFQQNTMRLGIKPGVVTTVSNNGNRNLSALLRMSLLRPLSSSGAWLVRCQQIGVEAIDAFAAAEQQALSVMETRKASQRCIGAIAQGIPELFGGSADLTGSNNTRWDGATDAQHMSYGVREFAMTAISNGLQLHGGYWPFTGTFLIYGVCAKCGASGCFDENA